jgi:hypothetical protein
MPNTPIACTLTATAITDRIALIDALAADGLRGRARIDGGVRVRLRDTPEIERRTRALVAAEAACCPFLEFALARRDGDLLLDVTGPADAQPVIATFFEREP